MSVCHDRVGGGSPRSFGPDTRVSAVPRFPGQLGATPDAYGTMFRFTWNTLPGSQVRLTSTRVDGAETRRAVSAATDREVEASISGVVDRGHHVADVRDAHDGARAPVDHPAHHRPSLVVALVALGRNPAAYGFTQCVDPRMRSRTSLLTHAGACLDNGGSCWAGLFRHPRGRKLRNAKHRRTETRGGSGPGCTPDAGPAAPKERSSVRPVPGAPASLGRSSRSTDVPPAVTTGRSRPGPPGSAAGRAPAAPRRTSPRGSCP